MEFLSFVMIDSLRAVVLAAAAGIAMAVCRVKSPAARHAVWTIVVAGMLAIAVVASIAPAMPVRVLPARPLAAIPAVAAPVLPLPQAPLPPPGRPLPWGAMLYAAGLLVCAVRLAYGYALTRRLILASRRLPQFEGEAVYESTNISVPLTTGWLRPKILLPADWRAWDQEKLAAVLVHERNHVKRGDWAIAVIAAVNRCVWWFHPLAWWLEARIKSLAEQACDDASLAQVASRECYAEVLVEMAAAVRSREGRVGWEAMAMAKGAEVRMRVERILDESRRIFPPMTRTRWTMLAVCAMPVIYFTAVARPARVLAQETPPPPQATPGPAVTDADLKMARGELEQTERDLVKFKTENMGRLPEQFQNNVAQLTAYQMQLANANEVVTHLQQEKLLEQTQLQNLESQKRYFELRNADDNPKVQLLEQKMMDLQSQLASAREMYTEKNPNVLRMLAQIASWQRELQAERTRKPNERELLDLEASMAMLKTQIQNTQVSMDEKLKRAQELTGIIAQYQQRIESSPRLEEQYAALMLRFQKALEQVQELSRTGAGATAGPRFTSPIAVQRGNVEGKVELSITVDAEGRVVDAEVTRGLGAAPDRQAIAYVKGLRFHPASRNGQPVTAFAIVQVPFGR